MGVLIARALQQNLLKDREKAEQSLREYHAFYLREPGKCSNRSCLQLFRKGQQLFPALQLPMGSDILS